MHKLLISLLLPFFMYQAPAQTTTDSATVLKKATEKAAQDSMNKRFFAHAVYPMLKGSKFSGVIPVENTTDKLNPNLQYKLVLEVLTGIKDSTEAKDMMNSFAEAGRVINLHLAAGVPLKNLHVVFVVHGGALDGLLTNEAYQKKYKTGNPNLAFFKELQDIGVHMVACGQAMFFFDVKRENLIPGVTVAYSAKTAMTSYQMKGYVLHAGL
jgi:intracellular sulfur oxidation DsrE/DsrF family protein